jgi:hypothetical protein
LTASRMYAAVLCALVAVHAGACAPAPDGGAAHEAGAGADAARDAVLARVLEREMSRIRERAAGVDAIFQPLPLLRPAQEAALQRFGNAQQLAAARRLGVSPGTAEAELERLVREGRLVRIADTTSLWVVRELDYSAPYLTPDAAALLRDVAERFHVELDALAIPRYRIEVTSVLRSADDQARLQQVNPNAAAGESTHQYGTTFDIAYSAFAPPAAPIVEPGADADWLHAHLLWAAGQAAETVAARRSRELMAVLGRVLLALQQEGAVMVTLERLQPVYHMTVSRRRE